MAPTLKKALKGLKKGIPGGSSSLDLQGVSTGLLRSFLIYLCAKTSAQLTKTAQNLQGQANKGLQNTPVRDVVPKSVFVLKAFGRPFKSSYSRLRRMVG